MAWSSGARCWAQADARPAGCPWPDLSQNSSAAMAANLQGIRAADTASKALREEQHHDDSDRPH
jgi:hypothetical protein